MSSPDGDDGRNTFDAAGDGSDAPRPESIEVKAGGGKTVVISVRDILDGTRVRLTIEEADGKPIDVRTSEERTADTPDAKPGQP